MYVPSRHGARDLPRIESVRKYLAQAGHKVTIVRDTAALDVQVRGSTVDLLMTAPAEVSQVEQSLAALSSKPVMVALLEKRTPGGADAGHGFASSIATSDSPKNYLVMLDNVMKGVSEGRTRR